MTSVDHAKQSSNPSGPSGVLSGSPGEIVGGFIVPGLPHPLLAPEQNPGWMSLRRNFERARAAIDASGTELLVLYTTQWPSIIGHQMQADPKPKWTHVDPEFHDLGDMDYTLSIDSAFAQTYVQASQKRGLHARTVAYEGFPIDTGSIVALQLLNPDNRIPAAIVSCNVYADRAETVVLGKAAHDAIQLHGKKAIAVAVTALSNRMHTEPIDAADDRISSLKDDEWNRKVLELLGDGRLEDVSQLARQFHREANADNKMKALWWLAALMGQHNAYDAEVLDYQPIWGTGGAIVSLTPSTQGIGGQEFDEDDVEHFTGERKVLGGAESAGQPALSVDGNTSPAGPQDNARAPAVVKSDIVRTSAAPKPVGAYPHARRQGNMLYLSGVGPRQAGDDSIPGGPCWNEARTPQDYDAAAQTEAVIANVRAILEASGASLQDVVDVTVFLTNMQRDFSAFNEVYAAHFSSIDATRTTVEVGSLPTPIAVEFKVIAQITE